MVSGIQVLLFCLACDIRNASFDIWQLRHLNEAVSRHSVLSPVLGRSHFATDWSVAAVPMAFDSGTATENCGVIFSVSIEGIVMPDIDTGSPQGRNTRSTKDVYKRQV